MAKISKIKNYRWRPLFQKNNKKIKIFQKKFEFLTVLYIKGADFLPATETKKIMCKTQM